MAAPLSKGTKRSVHHMTLRSDNTKRIKAEDDDKSIDYGDLGAGRTPGATLAIDKTQNTTKQTESNIDKSKEGGNKYHFLAQYDRPVTRSMLRNVLKDGKGNLNVYTDNKAVHVSYTLTHKELKKEVKLKKGLKEKRYRKAISHYDDDGGDDDGDDDDRSDKEENDNRSVTVVDVHEERLYNDNDDHDDEGDGDDDDDDDDDRSEEEESENSSVTEVNVHEERHNCQLTEYKKIWISQTIFGARVHSKGTLKNLMGMATRYIRSLSGASFHNCPTFFRDKGTGFYEDTMKHHGGLMEVYKKDNHGDERSPINNRINGLFFNVNHNSRSRNSSIFGTMRLKIPSKFIYELCPNLYFADFYCSSIKKRGHLDRSCGGRHRPHYVTLVMTKPGSEADRFCHNHLVSLDKGTNSFLLIREAQFGDLSVHTWTVEGGQFWVEVLITEDIDIVAALKIGAKWENVVCNGFRSGRLEGLPKTINCTICNI